MDQTCHANSGALGASGHNGICLDAAPRQAPGPSALANGYFRAQRPACCVTSLSSSPLTGGAGELSTLVNQHPHCLRVKRVGVLDPAAATPPPTRWTGVAQMLA